MNTIEQFILATIFVDITTIDLITNSVTPEMFYDDKNRIIYESILSLKKKNSQIDLLTVTNDLRNKQFLDQIGGAYYISSITTNIANSIHVETHIKILIQDYIRREMTKLMHTAINELADGQNDIYDIFGSHTAKLEKLFDANKIEATPIGELINERISQIESIKPGKFLGVNTGHRELNEITGGWQGGDVIVLAGRPSMGKTAISLYFATNPIIENNEFGAYYSLEMSKYRLVDRILSNETTINSELIRTNKLNQSERMAIYDVCDKFAKANLYINDESMTIEQLTAHAIILDRKLKSKYKRGLGFIVIDYLQLITHSLMGNTSTNSQVEHISRSVKSLAKKLNIPIIELAQLNRDVDRRSGDKIPILSDLRDSGAIEQDADMVIFVHRPEYYGMLEDNDGNSTKNIINLAIAKHRNGAIGLTNMYKNDSWSYLSDKPIINNEEMPMF